MRAPYRPRVLIASEMTRMSLTSFPTFGNQPTSGVNLRVTAWSERYVSTRGITRATLC